MSGAAAAAAAMAARRSGPRPLHVSHYQTPERREKNHLKKWCNVKSVPSPSLCVRKSWHPVLSSQGYKKREKGQGKKEKKIGLLLQYESVIPTEVSGEEIFLSLATLRGC